MLFFYNSVICSFNSTRIFPVSNYNPFIGTIMEKEEWLKKRAVNKDGAFKNLKELREQCRYTQAELQEISGIDKRVISQYETGTRDLTLNDAIIFSFVFNVPLGYIVRTEELDIRSNAFQDLDDDTKMMVLQILSIMQNEIAREK